MSIDTMVSQELPEGWYDDPENPRLQRFWTGSDWTDHVRHSAGPARAKLSLAPELVVAPEPSYASTPFVGNAFSEPSFNEPAYGSAPAFAAPDFSAPAFSAPDFSAPAFSAPAFPAPSFSAPALAVAPLTAPALTVPAISAPLTYIGGGTPAPVDHFASEQVTGYVPMSHYYMPTTARVGASGLKSFSPGTGSVWFLALSPIIWTAAQLLASLTAPAFGFISLVISGAMVVALLIAVAVDGASLRRRNLQSPAFAWFLLGTVPYFVARWWALRSQGIRYMGPGIGYAVSIVVSVVAWAIFFNAI